MGHRSVLCHRQQEKTKLIAKKLNVLNHLIQSYHCKIQSVISSSKRDQKMLISNVVHSIKLYFARNYFVFTQR